VLQLRSFYSNAREILPPVENRSPRILPSLIGMNPAAPSVPLQSPLADLAMLPVLKRRGSCLNVPSGERQLRNPPASGALLWSFLSSLCSGWRRRWSSASHTEHLFRQRTDQCPTMNVTIASSSRSNLPVVRNSRATSGNIGIESKKVVRRSRGQLAGHFVPPSHVVAKRCFYTLPLDCLRSAGLS
jgi:hypothetical protein